MPTTLQDTANGDAKDGLPQCKRPPFGLQKTAFHIVSKHARERYGLPYAPHCTGYNESKTG